MTPDQLMKGLYSAEAPDLSSWDGDTNATQWRLFLEEIGRKVSFPQHADPTQQTTDIFLSYASLDRPRAKQLADVLSSHGLSVWWDRNIPHGQDFNETIQRELDAARCIVVLWSAASVLSRFVRDEATEGLDDGRLVPARLDDTRPPLGFRQLQTADLKEWKPGRDSTELDHLIASIKSVLQKTDSPRAPK
jgi:hypothetical protein